MITLQKKLKAIKEVKKFDYKKTCPYCKLIKDARAKSKHLMKLSMFSVSYRKFIHDPEECFVGAFVWESSFRIKKPIKIHIADRTARKIFKIVSKYREELKK